MTQKEKHILNKVSSFLYRISEIEMIYVKDKKILLSGKDKNANLFIQESPTEVFNLIQKKIVSSKVDTIEPLKTEKINLQRFL